MRTLLRAIFAASILISASAAFAAPRTVILDVQNVSCVTCVPIVKKTLSLLERCPFS